MAVPPYFERGLKKCPGIVGQSRTVNFFIRKKNQLFRFAIPSVGNDAFGQEILFFTHIMGREGRFSSKCDRDLKVFGPPPSSPSPSSRALLSEAKRSKASRKDYSPRLPPFLPSSSFS